jgi:uncharacterized protein (DUF427 family)
MQPVTPRGAAADDHEHGVVGQPCPLRSRAWWDGQLVAESCAAVRLEETGQPPTLLFPCSDVRFDLFRDEGREATSPVKGLAHLWSIGAKGRDVLWSFTHPSHDLAWLAGLAAFDHDRVQVELVDCLRTSRRLRVEVAGTVLVDTADTIGVYETALEPRLYVRPASVRRDLLIASSTTTYCPYKGQAWYWSAVVDDVVVEDVAWSYDDPLPESLPLRRLLCFDEARATVHADLPAGASV